MSDCGNAGLAEPVSILPGKIVFVQTPGTFVDGFAPVPNRVHELENEISLLNLAIVTLRVELADCRAAMHEAGLTFVDDAAPQRDPIFDALGQQYRGGLRTPF